MTTLKNDDEKMQESNDTNDTTDLDLLHDLGGVAVDGAAMETKAVEDGARVVVDLIEPLDGGDVVSMAVRADTISGRVFLDPQQADAVADHLADAAEDADE